MNNLIEEYCMEPDNIPTASSSQPAVGEEAHEDEFGPEDERDEEEIEIPSSDENDETIVIDD